MCYYLLPVGKIRFCSLLSPGFLGDKGHRLNGTPFWVEDLVEFLVLGKVSSDLETKFKDATKIAKLILLRGLGEMVLLEFGWARSGMRRNSVDSVQKNVC